MNPQKNKLETIKFTISLLLHQRAQLKQLLPEIPRPEQQNCGKTGVRNGRSTIKSGTSFNNVWYMENQQFHFARARMFVLEYDRMITKAIQQYT